MEDIIRFFGEYKHISVIVHVFSVIVGMGAALISDILFNVYIQNKKVNKNENKTLQILSDIVWISLLFIVASGIALFLSDPMTYGYSVKFLVKMTIVGVIIVNGYLFWHLIHPSLEKINFSDINIHHKYVKLRKVSFVLGAISLVSWLSAFVLGMLGHIPLSYLEAIVGYIAICFGGALFSQVVEYKMTHGKIKS